VRVYLLTANHVVDKFERRVVEDSSVRWQVSFPAGTDRRLVFDSRDRVRSRSRDEDAVAIELTEQEAERVGAPICSTPLGWPLIGTIREVEAFDDLPDSLELATAPKLHVVQGQIKRALVARFSGRHSLSLDRCVSMRCWHSHQSEAADGNAQG
jgi:hypothetical protein